MMSDTIKVVFSGVCGRMGLAILRGIIDAEGIQVVGAVDRCRLGENIGLLLGGEKRGVVVSDDLDQVLASSGADVMLDFTVPEAVAGNIRLALKNRVASVIGTTGLTEKDLAEISELSAQSGRPVFIVPNFAIGAVLMMRFAQEASRFMPHVEIIELHHDQKLDAPSGTALKTLEMMAEARMAVPQGAPGETEKIPGSRGGNYQGMRVHSVRLPGLVAHQEVLFGGIGQTLSIRHDSISRDSFIPGVLLALRQVHRLTGLVSGLEKVM